MKAANETTSFQVLEQKLYEAPVDGYVQEKRFTIDCSKRKSPPLKHIYVRFRKPGFYARFDLQCLYPTNWKEKCLYIEAEGGVNPYGDRCLEPIVWPYDIKEIREKSADDKKVRDWIDKSDELYIAWGHEAEDAIRRQVLAPRPDFAKWAKEGLVIY